MQLDHGDRVLRKPQRRLVNRSNSDSTQDLRSNGPATRESNLNCFVTSAILPATNIYDDDGNVVEHIPAELCPELLIATEAARYLRLDLIDVEHPEETLNYYRSQGLLRGTQVGKAVRYRRVELDRFLERQTNTNPR